MKIHRGPHRRPLDVSIGRADRDPMFKPVWYDGMLLLTETLPAPLPEDVPPDPPPDPMRAKWEAVIERANEVNARLRGDHDFSSKVLLDVVTNIVDMDPSVDEIVAAYRKRRAALAAIEHGSEP